MMKNRFYCKQQGNSSNPYLNVTKAAEWLRPRLVVFSNYADVDPRDWGGEPHAL